MSQWTAEQLDRIGAADELQITTRRPDGSLHPFVPIWVVRVGDQLHVRSYRGRDGAWYRHALRDTAGRIEAGGIECEVRFAQLDDTAQDAVERPTGASMRGTATPTSSHDQPGREGSDAATHSPIGATGRRTTMTEHKEPSGAQKMFGDFEGYSERPLLTSLHLSRRRSGDR